MLYLACTSHEAFLLQDYLQLSEGNPAKDPLTLWMNGGPGCTSLKGKPRPQGHVIVWPCLVVGRAPDPRMY